MYTITNLDDDYNDGSNQVLEDSSGKKVITTLSIPPMDKFI